MEDSILTTVKKVLGIHETYTEFDLDILTHINSVFPVLTQLGVGPENGFMIEDEDTTWDEYLGDDVNLNLVRTYICLKVRLLFDPPGTSFHLNALQEQAKELEWRINTHREATRWAQPVVLP